MTDEIRETTESAIRQLRDIGRPEEAQHLHAALHISLGTQIADAFPLALREACQTVLTAIEAIDPNTEMLLEQLRAKIDQMLTPHHRAGPAETDNIAGGGKAP